MVYLKGQFEVWSLLDIIILILTYSSCISVMANGVDCNIVVCEFKL